MNSLDSKTATDSFTKDSLGAINAYMKGRELPPREVVVDMLCIWARVHVSVRGLTC